MLIPILGWVALLKPAIPPNLDMSLNAVENKIEIDEGLGGVCHCLRSAEYWTGKYGHWGSASNVPVNLEHPRVGAIILMHSGYYGHAGAVTSFTNETVTFRESGWYGCDVVDYRTLPRDHWSIRGYYW